MSDLDVFGPMVVDTGPGLAVELTLQTWMATYLAALDRLLAQAGIDLGGPLPPPAAYVHSSDPTHFPEESDPAVVIVVPGTLGDPKKDGGRLYRAFWDVRLMAYVSSGTRELTENLAKYYATVLRAIMVNKPSLGDFAAGTDWRGTTYGMRSAPRADRTLGSCDVRFSVDVRSVSQAFAGPNAPITTVPPDWPTVTSVKTTIAPTSLS